MTSMMEKRPSTKAKTYNRFNSTQDHGSAQEHEGHRKKAAYADSYWENKYNRRKIVPADEAARKEAVDSGLHDHQDYDKMTPEELVVAANQILADAESRRNVEEFEGVQSHNDHEPLSYEEQLAIDEAEDLKTMTREEYADYQDRHGLNQNSKAYKRRLGKIANARKATLDPDYNDDDYLGDFEDGSSIR